MDSSTDDMWTSERLNKIKIGIPFFCGVFIIVSIYLCVRKCDNNESRSTGESPDDVPLQTRQNTRTTNGLVNQTVVQNSSSTSTRAENIILIPVSQTQAPQQIQLSLPPTLINTLVSNRILEQNQQGTLVTAPGLMSPTFLQVSNEGVYFETENNIEETLPSYEDVVSTYGRQHNSQHTIPESGPPPPYDSVVL